MTTTPNPPTPAPNVHQQRLEDELTERHRHEDEPQWVRDRLALPFLDDTASPSLGETQVKSSHTMLVEAMKLLVKVQKLVTQCEKVATHVPHKSEADCQHLHCRTRRGEKG